MRHIKLFNESTNNNLLTPDKVKDYIQVLIDEFGGNSSMYVKFVGAAEINFNNPNLNYFLNKNSITGYKLMYELDDSQMENFIQLLKGICFNISMDYKNVFIITFSTAARLYDMQRIIVEIRCIGVGSYCSAINSYIYMPIENEFLDRLTNKKLS